MRFIARFAMRGPMHAGAMAAAAQLGALAIGLLIVIAGAVVALTTLRHGSREGLRVMMIATSLAVAVRVVVDGHWLPMLVLCLVVWLPSWMMALNLGRTQQQGFPLVMVAVLVGAYAIAIRVSVGDVAGFWAERLLPIFAQLAQDGGMQFSTEDVRLIAGQVHTWTLVAMFTLLASIILLARWWQAALFNPGGFGSEFRALWLPSAALVVAVVTGVGLVAQTLSQADFLIAGDVFAIVVVLFAFQGLAVIHHRARAVKLSGGWLTGLYVLLVLTPQIVGPVLATTGVADRFADFRRLGARDETVPERDTAPRSDDDGDGDNGER